MNRLVVSVVLGVVTGSVAPTPALQTKLSEFDVGVQSTIQSLLVGIVSPQLPTSMENVLNMYGHNPDPSTNRYSVAVGLTADDCRLLTYERSVSNVPDQEKVHLNVESKPGIWDSECNGSQNPVPIFDNYDDQESCYCILREVSQGVWEHGLEYGIESSIQGDQTHLTWMASHRLAAYRHHKTVRTGTSWLALLLIGLILVLGICRLSNY